MRAAKNGHQLTVEFLVSKGAYLIHLMMGEGCGACVIWTLTILTRASLTEQKNQLRAWCSEIYVYWLLQLRLSQLSTSCQ